MQRATTHRSPAFLVLVPNDDTSADFDRRHQWLVSIKRPIRVSPYTYICSLHFKDNKKESNNDIPTIFPWTPTTTPTTRKPPALRPFTPPEPKKRKQEADTTKQLL